MAEAAKSNSSSRQLEQQVNQGPADNQTIVASKYQLYLPTEKALTAKVKEIDKQEQL
ncbi:hypothetical protein MON38_20870 [Hymenobacter sp. DH14]|uniref:Uncharacterized protein n=1 Tax=Hymenobacter cyanobacteriorum TaxID=2926463 RepID=A0A9X1VJN7_9BACT|nr:hypothetical protein [Hymenobacter cyanobacteriorum]MCI1189883.1 hypothetical protein [Hymenobacter cyanobacteriorum]